MKALETHNAVYQKCYDKIGEANPSSSTVIPHKRIKIELRTDLCIFCGEIHSAENFCADAEEFRSGISRNYQHLQNLTESWSEVALAIADLDVHAKSFTGDILSNEILYH